MQTASAKPKITEWTVDLSKSKNPKCRNIAAMEKVGRQLDRTLKAYQAVSMDCIEERIALAEKFTALTKQYVKLALKHRVEKT